MFWADELLQNRKGEEWINDAWTPSGIVHMGGLKGPVIHDTLYKILKAEGASVKWTFGFDDFDPIDGLPEDLKISHEQYMGVPVCNAPGLDGKKSFAEYYSDMMQALFKELGIEAEIYLASDYYKRGVYNKAIQFVLDNTDKVKTVYEEMYKNPLNDEWYPLQVVCPNCGKLGTTKVTAWDGQKVKFICSPNLVKWAVGCGTTGSVNPFDGNAKMPFKVEWAAKWWTFGVTIEGAGKDHASAGGTYDVARKICKDVFGKEPPLKLPYEFFLSGGKKMSSSKGLGLTGEELLRVLPPEVTRYLMIKTDPNTAVEFNPFETQIIPDLYDDYQESVQENHRAFELSQLELKMQVPTIRFRTLAQLVQMPNKKDEIKKETAEEWANYAKIWIEKYAPESEKFLVQQEAPEAMKELTQKQKELLKNIAFGLEKDRDAEAFQTQIYETGKALGLNGKETFAAIYIALLGKNHGPKAAWLILSLDIAFVKERFLSL